jgi:outer membrane protein assembly factor BamB
MKTDKDLYEIVVDKPLDHITKSDFQYVHSDNLYFINYSGRREYGPYSIAFDPEEFTELTDHDIRVIIQNHINEREKNFKNRILDSFTFKEYNNIINEVYHPNASEVLGK